MNKFFAYFRIFLTDALEYRGDILLYAISSLMLPITNLLLWLAVINSNSSPPLSQAEFVRYYLFLTIVGLWVFNWGAYFISRDIRLGRMSVWIIKPAPFIYSQAGNNISEKILKTIYLIPVLIIFGLIFEFSWPILTPLKWILFFVSLVFAGIIAFLIDISIGLLAFWLDDSNAVRECYSILYLIFSGRILPIITLPLFLQRISFYLPFRYTLSLPLEIVLDKLTDNQLFQGLLIQILLIIISIYIYKTIWKQGIIKYSASGN
jgi:ABC-2 type transport system permease protein